MLGMQVSTPPSIRPLPATFDIPAGLSLMIAALSANARFVAPRPVEIGPMPSKTTPSARRPQGSDRTAKSAATVKSVELRIAGEALFTIAIDLSPTFVARGPLPAANADSTAL